MKVLSVVAFLAALPPAAAAASSSSRAANLRGLEVSCPCWMEDELLAVTASNKDDTVSCLPPDQNGFTRLRLEAPNNGSPLNLGRPIKGFFAVRVEGEKKKDLIYSCASTEKNDFEVITPITNEEGEVCLAQIEARCEAIGHPI